MGQMGLRYPVGSVTHAGKLRHKAGLWAPLRQRGNRGTGLYRKGATEGQCCHVTPLPRGETEAVLNRSDAIPAGGPRDGAIP